MPTYTFQKCKNTIRNQSGHGVISKHNFTKRKRNL